MMLRVLGLASLAEAAVLGTSTKKCDTFVDQTDKATHSTFQTSDAHGLTTGNLVYYEAGAGGYTSGTVMPDKALYQVTSIAAGAAGTVGKFKLKLITKNGTPATDFVILPSWSAVEGVKMNNGTFRKVNKAVCIASNTAGVQELTDSTDGGGAKKVTLWKAGTGNAPAAALNERVTFHSTYQGNAATLTNSGLTDGSEYKIVITGADNFYLTALTVTGITAHANALTDAKLGLPGTTGAAITGATAHVCFINWKGAADDGTAAVGKTAAENLCAAIPKDKATCKAADDKKQFFDAATGTCKAGTDALCKAADAKKPKWNATKHECEAAAASYAHRAVLPALATVFISLFA